MQVVSNVWTGHEFSTPASSFASRRDAVSVPADGPPARAESPAGAPLASLAGGALARRFHSWRGASGTRYVCSVFAPEAQDELASYAHAVVICVSGSSAEDLRIVAVHEVGVLPEQFWDRSFLARSQNIGVVEFHLHLLAETADERQSVINDLRRLLLEAQAS
jgi:hypothetical protein